MDLKKLKYEMDKNKMSQKELAKLLKLSKSALNNRLNGKSCFLIDEIYLIIEKLKIENASEIFFNEEVKIK